ncbi:hypothetical protein BJ138DRAFT_1240107 [Hygrophoropsis aurantiaca]|uniref:Uncharacterized protein n=1 Tax=Hygrophoropsis aurantiaca TaxID=72124 RepID=A0ACB8AD70_9AGAM|nr:hypothetical protein BJ138DRAFT_1240107 [Hygrophoropsis aurantiaca]
MSSSNITGGSSISSSSILEPPQPMQRDDPSAADSARRRVAPKSRLPLFSSLPNLRSHHKASKQKSPSRRHPDTHTDDHQSHNDLPPLEQTNDNNNIINLDESALPQLPADRDVYRWAVVYENQRGITIFSTPYYSPLSLLPSDPLPFTVPSKTNKRSHQPNVSLTNYPLPDGTWKWLSKAWMIDMRTNSGEVQHDGFEYNWMFRDRGWSGDVGKLSAGAWVRRRRWVRLMTRPAKRLEYISGLVDTPFSKTPSRPSTSFVSLIHPASEFAIDIHRKGDSFDGSEQDWIRCHRLLKRLGRDGRKLELWTRWLDPLGLQAISKLDSKGKRALGQCSDDDGPLSRSSRSIRGHEHPEDLEISSPSREHLSAIFRNHGETILRSFIFPDSRARFLDLLEHAGLLDTLEIGLSNSGESTSKVDFWSYGSGLVKILDAEQQRPENDAENTRQKRDANGQSSGEALAKGYAYELEKQVDYVD